MSRNSASVTRADVSLPILKQQIISVVAGRVFKISGTVEITEGRKVTRAKFVGGLASGPEDSEIRKSFQYFRTFYGKTNESQRKKYRDLCAAGCVRLVDYQLHGECGIAAGLKNRYI